MVHRKKRLILSIAAQACIFLAYGCDNTGFDNEESVFEESLNVVNAPWIPLSPAEKKENNACERRSFPAPLARKKRKAASDATQRLPNSPLKVYEELLNINGASNVRPLVELASEVVVCNSFSGFKFGLPLLTGKLQMGRRRDEELFYAGDLVSLETLHQQEKEFRKNYKHVHKLIVKAIATVYRKKIKLGFSEEKPEEQNKDIIYRSGVGPRKGYIINLPNDDAKDPLKTRIFNAYTDHYVPRVSFLGANSLYDCPVKMSILASPDSTEAAIECRYCDDIFDKKSPYNNSSVFTYGQNEGDSGTVSENTDNENSSDTVKVSCWNPVAKKEQEVEISIPDCNGKAQCERLNSKESLIVYRKKDLSKVGFQRVRPLPFIDHDVRRLSLMPVKDSAGELLINPLDEREPYDYFAKKSSDVTVKREYNGRGFLYCAVRQFSKIRDGGDTATTPEAHLIKTEEKRIGVVQVRPFKYLSDVIKAYKLRNLSNYKKFV